MKARLFGSLSAAAMVLFAAANAVEPAKPLADGLYAILHTNKGKIVLRLEFEKTPLTVTNFVGLAEGTKSSNKPAGTLFYDGLTFHRVIPNFMVQGGDPDGTGGGGPGYRFADETRDDLKHTGPGVLSMANAGPGTNGSQFFITHVATPWLDGKHTVFGKVIEGQDVVNAIAQGDRIQHVEIQRVGAKAKAFVATEEKFQNLLKERENQVKKTEGDDSFLKGIETKHQGKIKTTPSGLRYIVLKDGTGPKPVKGATIKAHYTGNLVNGKKFDSSVDRGTPIDFAIGVGQVIPAWDEALLDMKQGEKRILIIPPKLGYGSQGAGGVIPPNATLVFEVELVSAGK